MQIFLYEDIMLIYSIQKLAKHVFFHMQKTVLQYDKYFLCNWPQSEPYPKKSDLKTQKNEKKDKIKIMLNWK